MYSICSYAYPQHGLRPSMMFISRSKHDFQTSKSDRLSMLRQSTLVTKIISSNTKPVFSTRKYHVSSMKCGRGPKNTTWPIDMRKSILVKNHSERGLFTTHKIAKSETIFSELPLLSSQITLSKNFVRACDQCGMFLNVHRSELKELLPEPALQYMPHRHSNLVNFQAWEGEKKHYCSAECFDQAYMDFLLAVQVSKQQPSSSPVGGAYDDDMSLFSQKSRLDQLWAEHVPSIPPELILKAIAKEILFLNPSLKPYSSKPIHKKTHHPSATDRSKSDSKSDVRLRTPKSKLKILEHFRVSTKLFSDITMIYQPLADFATEILMDYSPFFIEAKLIEDTFRRIYENQTLLTLEVPQEQKINQYFKQAEKSPDDIKKIEMTSNHLKTTEAGDLELLWKPHLNGLFSAKAMINHSCDPNAFITSEKYQSCQIRAEALRDIQKDEEITISYLPAEILHLDTPTRQKAIQNTFGFICACPRCKQL